MGLNGIAIISIIVTNGLHACRYYTLQLYLRHLHQVRLSMLLHVILFYFRTKIIIMQIRYEDTYVHSVQYGCLRTYIYLVRYS